MPNLVEALQAQVTPEVAGTLAELHDETAEATATGLRAALITLLGALSVRAGHDGMPGVMRAAATALEGGNPLDTLPAALHDPARRATLLDHGDAILSQLLGARQAPVTADLARHAGVKPDSMADLLRIAGPMLFGAIATRLGGHPDALPMADLLAAEAPATMAALPPGMEARLAPLAAAATPLHGTPVEAAAESAASASRWVPWLIAAVVAVALIAGVRNWQEENEPTASAVPPIPTPMVTEAPAGPVDVDLPDGARLSLQPGSLAYELIRYLNGTDPTPRAFRFEELAFDSTDSNLDAAGTADVRAVSAVLKAWPTVRARIVAHTDSDGDASSNLLVSDKRAEKIETLIESDGIAPDRIESEGRGAAEPIATNDTAEGRAQNRRIVLVVISR